MSNETKNNRVFPFTFIEEYYPNYHNSDEIARLNDLDKLLDEEYNDGDSAYELLVSDYGNNINNPKILADQRELLIQIYDAAAENFLKLKQNKISAEEFVCKNGKQFKNTNQNFEFQSINSLTKFLEDWEKS